jgi:hypothetical protein
LRRRRRIDDLTQSELGERFGVRQAGSLPPEQADIYREFIEYFRVRAIDI